MKLLTCILFVTMIIFAQNKPLKERPLRVAKNGFVIVYNDSLGIEVDTTELRGLSELYTKWSVLEAPTLDSLRKKAKEPKLKKKDYKRLIIN